MLLVAVILTWLWPFIPMTLYNLIVLMCTQLTHSLLSLCITYCSASTAAGNSSCVWSICSVLHHCVGLLSHSSLQVSCCELAVNPYNLYCVGGDVKHCTIQSNPYLYNAYNDWVMATRSVVVDRSNYCIHLTSPCVSACVPHRCQCWGMYHALVQCVFPRRWACHVVLHWLIESHTAMHRYSS